MCFLLRPIKIGHKRKHIHITLLNTEKDAMFYPRRRYLQGKEDKRPCPYTRVEGPVPEDVWEHSDRLSDHNLNRDGIAHTIVRLYGESLYLQVATFSGGWLFFPCIDTRG